MVGNIYFINMPYSDFTKSKGRPVLVYKKELCIKLECSN